MSDCVSVDVNQPYIPNDDSKAIASGTEDEFRDNQYSKAVITRSSASLG